MSACYKPLKCLLVAAAAAENTKFNCRACKHIIQLEYTLPTYLFLRNLTTLFLNGTQLILIESRKLIPMMKKVSNKLEMLPLAKYRSMS